MLVEADISDEWDSRTDWTALTEKAVLAAVAHSRIPKLTDREIEVSIKLTSDEEMRSLNASWRGRDKPTNVLSFPMSADPEQASMLGDIVLAAGVCAREAREKRIPVEQHAAHLVVHGTLHLLGYDHETSDAEAEEMETVERLALAAIGIADPYRVTEVQS